TVLPDETTTVNLNTATAEVIAAMIPDANLGAVKSFVAQRERLPLTTLSAMNGRMGLDAANPPSAALVSINTRYFWVHGMIRYDRVESQTETLIRRDGYGARGAVQVVWQHRT